MNRAFFHGLKVVAQQKAEALLLDLFPGAAAAFSLRKLRAGYTGAAIRVRRSSDDAEQDIGFDANGDLDTASLLAFVGSGDGFVVTIYDQSPNNNHLIPALGDVLIVQNGSLVVENGKPALFFPLNGILESLNPYPTTSFQHHFYVASSTDSNSDRNRVLDTRGLGSLGANPGWFSAFNVNQNASFRDNGIDAIGTQNVFRSGQNLASVFIEDLFISEYTNSVLINQNVSTISGSFNSGSKLYVGGLRDAPDTNQAFTGTMQEIICFNIDKKPQRQDIEANINNYYNVF